jgi:proteasome alpha subunit
MAMQFYASPEQIMRDRSEFARKNIARGRNVVVLSYEGGVLFVAENLSTTLHKVSEIYDRIGFAAVGRYNEFENLRAAGVRLADLRGYSYDRRDVTGRALATAYAQTLGAIFTEQSKPFEVEICVAEVGQSAAADELYRLTYDGSVSDEPGFVVMGGQVEALSSVVREGHAEDMGLAEAIALAVKAIGSVGGEGGAPRTLVAHQLEIAVLDRRKVGRAFRRITGAALTALLPGGSAAGPAEDAGAATDAGEPAEAAADESKGGPANPVKATPAKTTGTATVRAEKELAEEAGADAGEDEDTGHDKTAGGDASGGAPE